MRIALYARVSTDEQHPDAQLDDLRAYAARRRAEMIEFVDRLSGAKARRPALDALMEAVHRREVDAVACVKLDRMARSVHHLCDLANDLRTRDVALIVLDQGIDTSTSAGRFLFHTLGAVAELERDLIRERTKAGLQAAKRRGERIGRPPKLDSSQRARARRLAANGHSVRRVAELLGCSPNTALRAIRGRR